MTVSTAIAPITMTSAMPRLRAWRFARFVRRRFWIIG
jgi:hypothetical protein